MTYETLLPETMKALPEFQEAYDKSIREDTIDVESGLHIVFGCVFTPLLKKAIFNDSALAKRMFDHLEKMAGSEDKRVQEVCDQSVLETLCDEFRIRTIWSLAGEKTREGIKAISQYMTLR